MLSAPALALEVYQWTDENGVVHFSQWAPGDAVENVETVNVRGGGQSDNGLGVSEKDDPEGYKAHEEAMEELRAEIEARREAERRARANAPRTEVVYLPSEPYYRVPFFGHGFHHKFHLGPPHHRPRPPKPRPDPGDIPDEGAPRSLPYKRP